MSNFAAGKNVEFTVHILLRPTLSIPVTETIVKSPGESMVETETLEVESGVSFQHVVL